MSESAYHSDRVMRGFVEITKAGAGPRATKIVERMAGNPKPGTQEWVHTRLVPGGSSEGRKDVVMDAVKARMRKPTDIRDANWAMERASRANRGPRAGNRFTNAEQLTRAATQTGTPGRAQKPGVKWDVNSRGEALRRKYEAGASKIGGRSMKMVPDPTPAGEFGRARMLRQGQLRRGEV